MKDKLGRYRLVRLLATGGMGEVFLARQEGPGGFAKMVVVKRILRHLANDQGFIDLFLNEARLAAQLQHPHIAQVFGLEREANEWFIAMEYVHGRSLRDVLETAAKRGRRVPVAIAVRLASQALQGLHAAHELTDEHGRPLGILHRDVTPENLLLSYSGLIKLVDFGIARAMTGAVTRVGRPKGKVSYMAPELTVRGAAVDRRADVYAVGVVLYELLTGALPACVPERSEDLSAPRPPWVNHPDLPAPLNALLKRALAPDPNDRFSSAHELSAALEAWLTTSGTPVLPADVATWLVELYGKDVVEANPAVVQLRGGGLAELPLGGTAPLSPDSHVALIPVKPPRNRWRWAVAVGGSTALVLGFVLAVALWPRTKPLANVVDASVPVTEDAGAEGDAGLAVALPLPEVEAPDAGEAAAGLQEDAGVEVATPAPRRKKRPTRTGRVVFKVTAGAEVWWGSRRLGVTPLDPVDLPAGVMLLTLKHPQTGASRQVAVKVRAGGTAVVRVDFVRR